MQQSSFIINRLPLLFSILVIIRCPNFYAAHINIPSADHIKQIMLLSAWGDGLGRVTERLTTWDLLKKNHPQGVYSSDNFNDNDWYEKSNPIYKPPINILKKDKHFFIQMIPQLHYS